MTEGYSDPKACLLPKQAISNLAENLATTLGYRPGSNLEPIVIELGGKITYHDLWDMDLATSGSILVEKVGDFQIHLSNHTSLDRDRFTVAHELGHYFLHYMYWDAQQQPVGRMKAARYGSGTTEYEANWFAASFLMPEADFRRASDELGKNISDIASRFGVSYSAAQVRLQALGIGS